MINYFEILGTPASFTLDVKALEKAYFNAQMAAHPDRQIGKSEAERVVAIERSMSVNEAYETLKNPLTRAEHLLALSGIKVNSDDDSVKPSQALLMEIMELREQIADARADAKKLLALVADIRLAADQLSDELREAFTVGDLAHAAAGTIKLHYLGKAAEEAHLYLYHVKAAHHDTHSHKSQ
jgi:molecular chaperone HscB